MAKNVLIFFPHKTKPNFGGPYTYLYHLQQAFQSTKVHLHFLHDLLAIPVETASPATKLSPLKKFVKSLLPKKTVRSVLIRRYLNKIKQEPFLTQLQAVNLNQFDAIHFHETVDVWRCYPLLKTYEGKIILTSHSPKPYHLELLEDVFGLQQNQVSKPTYQQLELIDNLAFTRADLLVAPCAEAASSYKKTWPMFSILTRGKSWAYIPTGIPLPVVQKSSEAIRQERHLNEDAFVVVFNGRHNEVKGFDLLVKAAKILLPLYQQLCFFVTGNNASQPALDHHRWIETGWTPSPQDYLHAGDLVIVPNRQTYFDLNVLQALSLGKPLLLSETGGNRYFRQFANEGIRFLPGVTAEAIVQEVAKAIKHRQKLAGSALSLHALFRTNFTLEQFASSYEQFYLSV